MKENEFGLGVFEVGILLLTHPERIMGNSTDILWIDCAGDEYNECAPYFRDLDGCLHLNVFNINASLVSFGSATGFVY